MDEIAGTEPTCSASYAKGNAVARHRSQLVDPSTKVGFSGGAARADGGDARRGQRAPHRAWAADAPGHGGGRHHHRGTQFDQERSPVPTPSVSRCCRRHATPFDAFEATRAFRTGDISRRVNQYVLLLAGDADHYVPLGQLWDQARMLTMARSITCRVFTRVEAAQAHCQVGNLPLAIAVMTGWLELLPAA